MSFVEIENDTVTTWTEILPRDMNVGWNFTWGAPWGRGAMFEDDTFPDVVWIEL